MTWGQAVAWRCVIGIDATFLRRWVGRQVSSLTWIKPQHQEAEEQGGQQALTEGQRKEVADCRVPELAQQRQ